MKKNLSFHWLWMSIFLLMTFTSGKAFQQKFIINNLALHTIRSVFFGNVYVENFDNLLRLDYERSVCRLKWYLSFVEDTKGNLSRRYLLWQEVLRCEPIFINFLAIILPEDQELAHTAIELHPRSAESWFWLVDALIESEGSSTYLRPQKEENRSKLIQLYIRGLEVDPYDSLRWRELGDLLQPVDKKAAIEAYLQSCFTGDIGSNGCFRAGQTAEELGDIENAIRYYRYSRWTNALKRADKLEASIDLTK
jgi:hypothetical protein